MLSNNSRYRTLDVPSFQIHYNVQVIAKGGWEVGGRWVWWVEGGYGGWKVVWWVEGGWEVGGR